MAAWTGAPFADRGDVTDRHAVVGELAHRVEHVPDQPSQPLEKCI